VYRTELKNSLVHYVQIFSFVGNFLWIFKTIQFWKRYEIRNQKTDIGICTDTFMAAIMDYKMAPCI